MNETWNVVVGSIEEECQIYLLSCSETIYLHKIWSRVFLFVYDLCGGAGMIKAKITKHYLILKLCQL